MALLGGYRPGMFARIAIVTLLLAGWSTASAEVVFLKDKAAVTGKILAEKRDLVLVDLGYTVLSIPRSQIIRIAQESAEDARPAKAPKGKAAPPIAASTTAQAQDGSELFRTARSNTSEKSVRDLVAQLGESVVQVSTPGGLG